MPEPNPNPEPNPEPTPTPTPTPEPGPKPKDETYSINVDGADRQVSLDELKTLASKSGGADKRFQEAAEIKKEGEKGARIGTLIESLSSDQAPSDADIKELAGLLGEDPTQFLQQIKTEVEDKATKAVSTGKITAADLTEAVTEMFGASPAEVKARLDHSNKRHVVDAQKELRDISDLAVDKDEIIGKMIVGKEKDHGDQILTYTKEKVAEDVLRKIQNGEPYGAEMVAASVQMVRSDLTKLGIPNRPDQQPIVLGLGPGQGIPLDVQADEPIKRIASNEPGGEDNLVKRYLQGVIKSVRNKR